MKRNARIALTVGGVISLLLIVSAIVFVVRRSRARPTARAHVEAPELPRKRTPLTFLEVAYDGGLKPGWQDWGWGPHDLGKGPAKVGFGSYGGIILFHEALPSKFGGLTFQYKAPSSYPRFLAVWLRHAGTPDTSFPTVPVELRHTANTESGFNEVWIGWDELNPEGLPFDRVAITANVAVGTDWVLLDKIGFTAGAPPSMPHALGPERKVPLAIECGGKVRKIDPLIYGFSMTAWDTFGSANRIGGNPITRLNWEAGNLWNTGSDWFFQNHATKGNLMTWIEDAIARGRMTSLVVPMIGWVAKDGSSVGFPRYKFGEQRAHDPYRAEAGDGYRPDGTPLTPGSPTLTSIEAPPERIKGWIQKLVERDRARGKRGVDIYILDNEPSLWNVTHRDVHPDPVSYDELLERTLKYASAIRAADPGATIAGPAEWGWAGYFDSAKDRERGGPIKLDRLSHGGKDLVPWYLARLKEHEEEKGERLLDVLDLHYYPQADGVFGVKNRTDAAAAALRIRSTRALWDRNYEDESWIREPIALIPRMQAWVADNYPGKKTMIGEWSFGGESHISGALATIEALGHFGRHGLDAAFYWGDLLPSSKSFWAFRAFRNFDGKGARFLDFALTTRETDSVSLFASRNEGRTRIVAIVSNRNDAHPARAEIKLDSCGRVRARRVFSFGPDSKELVEEKSSQSAPSAHVESLTPYTFKVIEFEIDPDSL
jgi:hypothetical protein